MRRRLGPLIALVVAVGVLLGLSVVGGSSGRPGSDPSSRANGPGGTLALYDWLGALGLSVQRVSGSFDLSDIDVLVLVEPTAEVSDADLQQIDDLLQRGGMLILATDAVGLVAGHRLVGGLGLTPHAAPAATAAPLQPYDVSDLVHHVPVAEGLAFPNSSPSTADVVPLLGTGGGPALVGVPAGPGRAFALGSPYPMTNDGLRREDSAFLVLSLLERATPRHGALRIGFDEVHHGERSAGGGASGILVGPVGLGVLLAGLVVVVFLAVSGRRLGRPVPAGDPLAVPSATTLVRAMAGLYERSRGRGGVAGRYAAELKERIGDAAGVDPRLDDAHFVALLQGWNAAAAVEVAATLARARALASGAASDSALLDLARHVDGLERRFGAVAADA